MRTTQIRVQVRNMVASGEGKNKIVEILMKSATKLQCVNLISYALNDMVDREMRKKQQAVEQSCVVPVYQPVTHYPEIKRVENLPSLAEGVAMEDALEKSFLKVYRSPGELSDISGKVWLNSHDRQKFRAWCKRLGHSYEDWYDATLKISRIQAPDNTHWVVQAFSNNQAERDMAKYSDLMGKLKPALDEYVAALRLEITDELLSTQFSLGDGRSVTWGNATIKDHRQRVDILNKNAVGNLQTAAVHIKAIGMLEVSHTKTLKQFKAKNV